MSVGGLVAYRRFKIRNQILNHALSTVSMVTILGSVWIIDENSLFPGFWAIIPTLGAACIIQSGK
jgi:peptidoglycan/LPS O-acetylase OafA/YrhL